MSEIAIAEIALSGLLSSEFVPSRGAIGISLPIPVSRWRGGPSPGSVRQQPILSMMMSRGAPVAAPAAPVAPPYAAAPLSFCVAMN